MMINLMRSSLRADGVVCVTWVGVVSDVESPSVLGEISLVVGGPVVGGGLKRAGRKLTLSFVATWDRSLVNK